MQRQLLEDSDHRKDWARVIAARIKERVCIINLRMREKGESVGVSTGKGKGKGKKETLGPGSWNQKHSGQLRDNEGLNSYLRRFPSCHPSSHSPPASTGCLAASPAQNESSCMSQGGGAISAVARMAVDSVSGLRAVANPLAGC